MNDEGVIAAAAALAVALAACTGRPDPEPDPARDGQEAPAQAQQAWYEGGGLVDATLGEWRAASDRDKLATAADWALVAPEVKAEVKAAPTMEALRPHARRLVDCIDRRQLRDREPVVEVAALCMRILWEMDR